MKPNKYGILLLVLSMVACNPVPTGSEKPMVTIHLNQIGYLPLGYKSAIVIGPAEEFSIIDLASNSRVHRGKLGAPAYWSASGDTVRIAEFSTLTQPGNYALIAGSTQSYVFTIGDKVYHELATASVRAFYFHRASTELPEKHAGIHARAAGHMDTAVRIHPSAASGSRPAGTRISSSKGWYDAGDYGKYIVNSAITVTTMMSAYEHFPETAGSMVTNIPESGDDTPDILDEIRWNLEWMLTMQDLSDGGVYHKLTTKRFPDMIMPAEDLGERWIMMKTTAATLGFAASMAQASRVYHPYDAEFSKQCLRAARHAWVWAMAHPHIHYTQPEDIHTGAYDQPGTSFTDEFFWAATELFLTTGEKYAAEVPSPLMVPEWRDGAALAVMNQLYHHRNENLKEAILTLADSLLAEQQKSPWDVSNDRFRWGSSGDFLNQAMILLFAYRENGDKSYQHAAQSTFDWILGKNPTGFSFVTGFGEKTPMHIHHRPSEADLLTAPQPGWVAGGPNPHNQEDCGPVAYTSPYPARAYLDQLCSYATNEIAINWNAALVYTSVALNGGR